jgi:hypothetical protein
LPVVARLLRRLAPALPYRRPGSSPAVQECWRERLQAKQALRWKQETGQDERRTLRILLLSLRDRQQSSNQS